MFLVDIFFYQDECLILIANFQPPQQSKDLDIDLLEVLIIVTKQ